MSKQKFLLLISVFIVFLSCKESNNKLQDNKKIFASTLDSIRYNNYMSAIKNDGTLQYFAVVKIKDINSGTIREICTKGNFLIGALHLENSSKYSLSNQKRINDLLKNNKTRYFEFKDTVALNNLGINNYTTADLIEFERSNNIDSIAKSIKGKWGMAILEDKKMLLLAHSLFNKGILTGEYSCFGGSLIHIDKQMLEEKRKRSKEFKKRSKD